MMLVALCLETIWKKRTRSWMSWEGRKKASEQIQCKWCSVHNLLHDLSCRFFADSTLSTERNIFIVNVIFRQKKFVAVD